MINIYADKETGYMSTEVSGNIETIIEEIVCMIDEVCNVTADNCDEVMDTDEKIKMSINLKKDITSLLVGLISDTYTEWKQEGNEEQAIEFPSDENG